MFGSPLDLYGDSKTAKMVLALLATVWKILQFFSYALATYTFFKRCVLPITGLISDLIRNLFSSRNPEVHWYGRTRSSFRTVTFVSPSAEEGPLLPLTRRDDHLRRQ